MLSLLRDRPFRLLFIGQAAVATGDSIMLLVLAVWTKVLTGSDSLAAAVMLAVAVPTLASPLLGWVADKVRRRVLLMVVYLGTAAAMLPLYLVQERADVWIIFVVAVAYGASFILASAGLAGLLQQIVPDERLPDANGALRSVREGLRLIGPIAGTGLYALVGAAPVVTLSVVLLLIAGLALALLPVSEAAPQPAKSTWLVEITAGFRHLLREPILRPAAVAMAVAFLAVGTLEAAAFAYVDKGLGQPATFVGVLVTVMGTGSVVGGVLAPKMIRRVGEPAALAVGLGCLALGLGPLATPYAWVGLVSVPLAGVGVAGAAIAFSTVMQRRTPRPLMGRVSTASDLLIGLPQTLALALSASLIAFVDYRWIFGVDAVVLMLVAVTLWRVRGRAQVTAAPPESVEPTELSGYGDSRQLEPTEPVEPGAPAKPAVAHP